MCVKNLNTFILKWIEYKVFFFGINYKLFETLTNF